MTGTLRCSAASISMRTKSSRLVEATAVLTVGSPPQSLADDSQERVALADPVGEDVEITPGGDRVDVEKDVFASEAARQPVVDPPGVSPEVFPSIADEDAAQHLECPRADAETSEKNSPANICGLRRRAGLIAPAARRDSDASACRLRPNGRACPPI